MENEKWTPKSPFERIGARGMQLPRYWRNRKEYLKMQAIECPHCDAVQFPKRDVCPHCGGLSEKMQKILDKQKHITTKQNVYPETNTIYPSVDITNPTYYRKSEDQYSRDIINYSDVIKPEVSVETLAPVEPNSFKQEIKVRPTEIIIYQAA